MLALKARRELRCVLLVLALGACLLALGAQAQRGDGDDDFDDASFDDNSYNSPSRDAEGSQQNPSNYSPVSEEDLDDDDDVDETHVSPQVAPDEQQTEQAANQQEEARQPVAGARGYSQQQQQQQARERPYYAHVAPQRFYAPPNSVLLANVDPNANFHYPQQQQQQLDPQQRDHMRFRRSTKSDDGDIEEVASKQPLVRRKRSKHYIGPVYTYVKTDKHARFKWGVKHKVGKKHG